jgi:hypothetical protein
MTHRQRLMFWAIVVCVLYLTSNYANSQTPLPAPGTVVVITPVPATPPGNVRTTITEPGKPAVVCITTPVPNTRQSTTVCR